MASVAFNQVLKIMTDSGVPLEAATESLNRSLALKGFTADGFDGVAARSIRKNIEGAILIRGDKTKVDAVNKKLEAIR
jgi:hypothetical protein